MTLIARTRNHGAPTMIGDILFTQKDVPQSIILPSICRDISAFIPADAPKPVGLAQKLYILNDHLCIAFAGDLFEIRDLLEDLRPFCLASNPNAEELKDFLKKYDYSKFKESAFFAMLIEDKGQGDIYIVEISQGKFSLRDTELFDESQSIGSGTRDFESVINEERKFLSSFQDGDPRQGIVKKGALIGRLLAEERYLLWPLQHQWGGGYEMVFYNGKRLEKLDNTAYILQTGNYDPNAEVTIQDPIMVQFNQYEGENLFITTVEMHHTTLEDEGDFIVVQSRALVVSKYLVPQIRRGMILNADAGAVNSFDTRSVGMGFMIVQPSGSFFKPSFYTDKTSALRVRFSSEEKRIQITMHKGIQGFINKMFKDAYTELTESDQ